MGATDKALALVKGLKASPAGRLVYEKGPTAMVVGGVAMMAGAGIDAVRRTPKYAEWVNSRKESSSGGYYAEGFDRTDKRFREAKRDIAIHTVKTYGPDVAIGIAGAASILTGHGIVDGRRASALAFAMATEEAFREYRGRVIEKYGEDADADIRLGNVEAIEVEDSGEVVYRIDSTEASKISPYSRLFDDTNPNWMRNNFYNKQFLLNQQSYFNFKLQENGFVFLNEVLEALGFEKTYEGQYIGWSLSKNPDSIVDFGLFYLDSVEKRMFMNDYIDAIWLDLNPDGSIVGILPRERDFRPEKPIDWGVWDRIQYAMERPWSGDTDGLLW